MRNAIYFPRRGEPPLEQPPYVRDPGDPYTLRLPMVECKFRTVQKQCGGCSTKGDPWCSAYDKPVDAVTCYTCKLEPKT